MARLFKHQLAAGVTLAAGLLLVASAAPAAAQDQPGGRMRVLVPSFESGKSKVGEKIAEKLKKHLSELPSHAPTEDKVVKEAMKKYGLKEAEMGCIQWRQLANQVGAELTLCGTVDEATNQVNASFWSTKSTSFDVPQFVLQSDEQAAQQVVQAFGTYVKQLQHLTFCNDYIQSESWQNALDQCNQAVELNPKSEDAHYMRGSALTKLDRPEEALAAYEKVLELSPMRQDALLAAGIITAKLGRQDVSQKYFQEYLALDPDNEEVRLSIATRLANEGDPAGALKLVEQKVNANASATILEYAGHFAMNAALAKQQARGPAGPGSNEEEMRLFRAAAQYYEGVLAKNDKPTPEVLQRLIIAYTSIGENAKAMATAERGTTAAPDNASIWFAYAGALRESKRVDEALKALDRVTQIDPAFANVNRTRALMLMDAGRIQEAVGAIKAAAEKGEIDASATESLSQQVTSAGLKLVQANQHEQAAGYFKVARDIGKSERSIGMANFFEGFSLVKQVEVLIGASVARPTAAAAGRAKPLLQRAKVLLEGAGGYPDQAATRASLLQQIGQFMEVADALIKAGR